ncbi:MAG: LysR family transcriptional regulator [Hyphomicrobiaceae bacterium]
MKRKTSYTPLAGISLKQLRALVATIEEGSNAAAAQRLNVTPPAIALQLKLLEQAVEMPLFDRFGQNIRPTAAGRELLAAAARIEVALSDCSAALGTMHGGAGGRIGVGVVSTAKYFAPRAFAAFARSHPGVEIDLFVGNRAEVIGEFESLGRDIVIMGRPPDGFDLVRAPIGPHPHVVIAAPDHRLAGRRNIRLESLSGEKWVVRENGSGTRSLMERVFDEARITPTLGMEIMSNETIKQAVMAGLGVAFLSAHTIELELKAGLLTILDVRGLPAMREWFAVRRAGKRLLPAAEELWSYLTTRGDDFLPRIPTNPTKG